MLHSFCGKTHSLASPLSGVRSQRLLASPDIPEATKAKLRAENVVLGPFALKKSIELKLRKFFTALGNLNRKATNP